MKHIAFFLVAILFISLCAEAGFAAERVRAYTKRDGTRVKSHYRTKADRTVDNNWSTRGNVNPYTGTAGTKPRSDERSSSDSRNRSTR